MFFVVLFCFFFKKKEINQNERKKEKEEWKKKSINQSIKMNLKKHTSSKIMKQEQQTCFYEQRCGLREQQREENVWHPPFFFPFFFYSKKNFVPYKKNLWFNDSLIYWNYFFLKKKSFYEKKAMRGVILCQKVSLLSLINQSTNVEHRQGLVIQKLGFGFWNKTPGKRDLLLLIVEIEAWIDEKYK